MSLAEKPIKTSLFAPSADGKPNQLIVIVGTPDANTVTRLAPADTDSAILTGDDWGAIARVAARLLREASGEEGER